MILRDIDRCLKNGDWFWVMTGKPAREHGWAWMISIGPLTLYWPAI